MTASTFAFRATGTNVNEWIRYWHHPDTSHVVGCKWGGWCCDIPKGSRDQCFFNENEAYFIPTVESIQDGFREKGEKLVQANINWLNKLMIGWHADVRFEAIPLS